MHQEINLIGRLGRDPEMRYLADGTPVCTFSVAVNRRYTTAAGEPVEQVTWFRVTCWRRLAETTYQYLEKGRQVYVVADRIEAEAWIDKATGEARGGLALTARRVVFLGGNGTRDDERTEPDEDLAF